MADDNISIISHVSLGTNNHEQAVKFYDAVLPTLGCKKVMEFPGAAAYGKEFPEFWVQLPRDGNTASTGNGSHLGFIAPTKDAVHAFHEAALAAGGVNDGDPGPRPDYGEAYYGCFILDLDGHQIEAIYWDMSK